MKRILASLALIAYLTIGGFGFFHSYQMSGHGHMEATPCPFMQDQTAICGMNGLGHWAAWQNMFAGTLPEAFSLIAVVICVAAFFLPRKQPSGKDLQLLILQERSSRVPPLYQLLFSKGILNPKAP